MKEKPWQISVSVWICINPHNISDAYDCFIMFYRWHVGMLFADSFCHPVQKHRVNLLPSFKDLAVQSAPLGMWISNNSDACFQSLGVGYYVSNSFQFWNGRSLGCMSSLGQSWQPLTTNWFPMIGWISHIKDVQWWPVESESTQRTESHRHQAANRNPLGDAGIRPKDCKKQSGISIVTNN